MLQQDYLFEWRTILDNAVLGAEIQGADMGKARERAAQLLTRYGLGQFLNHLPRQLSGGMRQRVALARTLCTEPDVVLLDEPFSALDSQTRIALADEVTEILRRERKTAILVTHDIGEAVSMAERVVVLSRRPGRVKSEHAIRFAGRRRPARRRSPRATRPSSTATSTRSGRSSRSMSKVETVSGTPPGATAAPSPQYLEWLRRERRGRLTVRVSQLALLAVFLVLWEVAPRLQPDQSAVHQLSVDDLADIRGTAEGHAAAGQHPRAHLGHRVRHRGRLHRGDGARHRDRRGAVVVGQSLQGARPLSGRAQRHAEDRVRAALLHLARRDAVDLRHVAGDLAVHHHPDDLQRLPGHRSEQDQAGADLRRQQSGRC